MKRFLTNYIALILILIGVLWVVGNFFSSEIETQPVRFEVTSGDGVFSITQNLVHQNLTKSSLTFVAYALVTGHYSHFQPGVYILDASMGLNQIVRLLTSGPPDVTVTIFPGMTLKEIDLMLAKIGIISADQLENLEPSLLENDFSFLAGAKNLEGFLMPDTYRIRPSSDASQVAKVVLENFQKKGLPLISKVSNPYRALIIASLLEKEVVNQNDKQLVAGIIEKRLKMGMPLQIDATVLYAACGGKFLNCQPLSQNDYKSNSPYNTYMVNGLPPSPIGNPTTDSIEAAITPKSSAYLYYLTEGQNRTTIFSKTFDEHNDSRAKYLGL